jgi:hypothetical protein
MGKEIKKRQVDKKKKEEVKPPPDFKVLDIPPRIFHKRNGVWCGRTYVKLIEPSRDDFGM